MRRTAALAALGLAAYAVFLLGTVPAPYVAARTLDATKGAVMLPGAQGTLWRGEAKARVFPRRGPPVEIETLTWHFQPASLLAGRFAFDVKLGAAVHERHLRFAHQDALRHVAKRKLMMSPS